MKMDLLQKITGFLCVLVTFGCNGNAPNPGVKNPLANIPIIDPDQPDSIKKWEASTYNVNQSKIVVVKLKNFYGTLGDSTPGEPKSVAIEVAGALKNGPTDAQQKAIESLMNQEQEIHSTVRKAIYDEYQKVYPIYNPIYKNIMDSANLSKILPHIQKGDELDSIIVVANIYVHESAGNEPVSIGFEFFTPWDEEHDMGVRIQGTEVLEVGTAHVAYPIPVPKQKQ